MNDLIKKHAKSLIFRKQRERLNLKSDALADVKQRCLKHIHHEQTKQRACFSFWVYSGRPQIMTNEDLLAT